MLITKIKGFRRLIDRNSRGDTIVEVLISIVLLGVILTTAYALATHNLANGVDANKRNTALGIAQSQINQISNAQSSLSSGLERYRKDVPFCINSDGTTAAATRTGSNGVKTCEPNGDGYATGITYDSATSNFTITTQWPRTGATNTNQVQLFYKGGQYYELAGSLPGDTTTHPRFCNFACRHNCGNCHQTVVDPITGQVTGGGDNPGGGPSSDSSCPNGGPPPCRTTCFTGETLVDMADGTKRRIDQIQVGDRVMSWNIVTQHKVPTRVTQTLKYTNAPTVLLHTSSGDVRTTNDHRFWTGYDWVPVGNLKIGSSVENSTGKLVKVLSIDQSAKSADVYNLHVDNPAHNYYAAGFLVHNSKPPGAGGTGGDYGFCAGGRCDPGCFTGETLVDMADGTRKRIDQVQVGDRVMTYDIYHHLQVPSTVTKTYKHLNKPTETLVSFNGSVNTTSTHRFWTGYDWVAADRLSAGSSTLQDDQNQLQLLLFAMPSQKADVYNLHVASADHNFYANGFLVHNDKAR